MKFLLFFLIASFAPITTEYTKGCHVDMICQDGDEDALNFLQKAAGLTLADTATAGLTFTSPPSAGSGAETSGVGVNAAGDLTAFVSAMVVNAITWACCVGAFSCLRLRYPLVFSNNTLKKEDGTQMFKDMPEDSPEKLSLFGWIKPALYTPSEKIADAIGLDNAMMIEFCNLGMRILGYIGVPMTFIMGLLNCFFGEYAAGEDYMSYLSFGNVANNSWLYWLHSFCVWGVVLFVQDSIHRAMKQFMPRRIAWLKKLPSIRANTIMVEGIPPEYQSDEKLASFWEEMMPGNKIKQAHVTKDTAELAPLVSRHKRAVTCHKEAEARFQLNRSTTPTVRESCCGAKVPAIEFWQGEAKALGVQINEVRSRIKAEVESSTGGLNLANGFVTFRHRSDAEIALHLDLSHDREEWVISSPPVSIDLMWNDLQQDPKAERTRMYIGYLLIALLYIGYLPCVIFITNIAKMVNLGPLQPFWASLAPTIGLQVMVAFLPTFLLLIFRMFFTLKADSWAQATLQNWYFWFQVVFVVLITAIGQNVMEFTQKLVTDPFAVFGVLADTMPSSTHFYMNFLSIQWSTHGMVMLRMVQIFKFKAFCALYDEEDARAMAEPEDQDYYGIGSRSAQWTIMLGIGIVFGTLSPPINLLGWIAFAVARLSYGHIIAFAETKKPDLGGVFFVRKLEHLFIMNVIYCILMTGVLLRRSRTWGPGAIAAISIPYVLHSAKRFHMAYSWENLPFHDVVGVKDASGADADKQLKDAYVQPEFCYDTDER